MDTFEDDLYTVTVVGDVRDPYPDFARMRAESPILKEEMFENTVYKAFRSRTTARSRVCRSS